MKVNNTINKLSIARRRASEKPLLGEAGDQACRVCTGWAGLEQGRGMPQTWGAPGDSSGDGTRDRLRKKATAQVQGP